MSEKDEKENSNYAPFQKCPVCEGLGKILADGYVSSVYRECPTCSGTRIIPMLYVPLKEEAILTDEHKEKLSKVYGSLWTEACYDPQNESTRNFAAPLCKIMQELNEDLKFKR